MLLSLVNVVAMGALFIHMFRKAKFATARRMALLPLAVCGVEMLVFGLLEVELFPLLTVLLTALRAVIGLCCVYAMQRDAAMARKQMRRMRCAQRREVVAVPNAAVAAA